MQALAELATNDEKPRARVLATIERMAAAGSPAVKSRGRKLLAKLQRSSAAPDAGRR
jgi:hypothetical protein